MGSCNGILAELFLKGTVEEGAVPEDVYPGKVCRAKVLIFMSARRTPFAASGDSGAGVFTIDTSGSRVVFGGMIVSIFVRDRHNLGSTFVVSQSRIFSQIKERTGIKWQVS